MNNLNKKAFGGLLRLVVLLGVLFFLPSQRIYYWQAWVFLSVFSVCVLMITIYLMKKDPGLLERRMSAGPGAEKEKSQKTIQLFASAAFIIVIEFPAIDHRFGWSVVMPYLSIIGDVMITLGLFIVFLVFRENSFTSGIIEVGADQKVISTGPYALIRHPMYFGALVMLLGVPPALGSWWGLFMIIPFIIVLVWRILDEERFLEKNLPGYLMYQKKVRYRLLPFVW
jgi:protein-S-isoprenylcysteine O-methyltransferase Ste14